MIFGALHCVNESEQVVERHFDLVQKYLTVVLTRSMIAIFFASAIIQNPNGVGQLQGVFRACDWPIILRVMILSKESPQ
jgi:hypothetical protein